MKLSGGDFSGRQARNTINYRFFIIQTVMNVGSFV